MNNTTKYPEEIYSQTFENIIYLARKYPGKAFLIRQKPCKTDWVFDLKLTNGIDSYLFVSADMDAWADHFFKQ